MLVGNRRDGFDNDQLTSIYVTHMTLIALCVGIRPEVSSYRLAVAPLR